MVGIYQETENPLLNFILKGIDKITFQFYGAILSVNQYEDLEVKKNILPCSPSIRYSLITR